MKTMIAYSRRSCVTGKEIKQVLGAIKKVTNRKAKCDLFIRWGSTEQFDRLKFKHEVNKLDAVKRTSNKLVMLQTMQAAGVTCIEFSSDASVLDSFKDSSGNVYIRNKLGVVRYANDFDANFDSYFSKPVANKRREYRVHVFRNKVLGAYEKIPLVSGAENRPALFKSDTCKFVRCNLDLENSRVTQDARQMCIAAVAALGLDFGGVDLIRDKDGGFTICEVNSSPGLNKHNIERLVEEIKQVISDTV